MALDLESTDVLELRKRQLELMRQKALATAAPAPEKSLKDVVVDKIKSVVPKSPADLLPPLPYKSMEQIPGASTAMKGGRIIRDNPEGALEALPAAAGGVAGLATMGAGALPAIAIAGGAGAAGELAKQYGRGKMGLNPVSPVEPKIPFTDTPLPPIPGIPERASRAVTEGLLQAGPEAIARGAGKLFAVSAKPTKDAAISMARRTQGFQKSQLASSKDWAESLRKMANANKAAEEALKRGDIPMLGGAEDVLENGQKLLNEGSTKVKNALKAANQAKATIPEEVVDSALLKNLDPKDGDELATALKIRENVKDILKDGALVPEAVAELRSTWGRLGFRDKTVGTSASKMYRKAWETSAELMEGMLEGVNPKVAKAFKEGMKQESMAQTTLGGVVNRLAGESGNLKISLPALGADLQRRASGPLSRLFYKGSKLLKNASKEMGQAVGLGVRSGDEKSKK